MFTSQAKTGIGNVFDDIRKRAVEARKDILREITRKGDALNSIEDKANQVLDHKPLNRIKQTFKKGTDFAKLQF